MSIKYEKEIRAAFGDKINDFLSATGRSMQQASDDLQIGIDNGCPIEAQLKFGVDFLLCETIRDKEVLAIEFFEKWTK